MKKIKVTLHILLIAIFVLGLGLFSARRVLAATTILFVAPAGLTTGACDSWANACDLQYALTSAAADSELWVKAGTYYPTTTTDQSISFQLKNGVALYGGFAGTETLRTERDWASNVSILNGDLLQDDSPNFMDDSPYFLNHIDNTYHVVQSNGVDATAILDGFTVRSGHAYSQTNSDNYFGAGMQNINSSPTITNVIFTANVSVYGDMYSNAGGAGMYNKNSSTNLLNVTFDNNLAIGGYGGGLLNDAASHPTLTDVTFSNNGSAYGGGMANRAGSNPVLTNVTINNNRAWYGCGMHNLNSSPILTNVTITGNVPYFYSCYGSGILNDASSPTLTDVTISNNSTGSEGMVGGMYNFNGSAPSLTRVLFSGNITEARGGGMMNSSSNPTLQDVIFSGNTAHIGGGMYNDTSSPILVNVTFDANAAAFGGGMNNFGGSPSLTNVTFSGNTADLGGALYNRDNSSSVLTNVTMSGNVASSKGGALFNESSALVLKNVVLWGNSAPLGAEIYNDTGGVPDITYSIVQGGYAGIGNLSDDPLLGMLANNGGFTKTMSLGAGSPAIDVADNATCPATDQRGVTRPQGNGCDMGAYEFSIATETPTLIATATLDSPETFTPTLTDSPTESETPTATLTLALTATPTLTKTPTPVISRTPTATLTSVPGVDFSGTPTTGNAPLTVQFTSMSSSVLSRCTWDFGDGNSQTFYPPTGQSFFSCPSPSHVYTSAGNFTVYLSVTKYSSGSSNSITKTNYIHVNAPLPTATVTRTPSKTVTKTVTRTPTATPVTVNFNSVAVQDGWILESGENTNVGGTLNNNSGNLALGDDAANRQYRAVLSFSTVALPENAVIRSVVLKLKQNGAVTGSDPFTVLGNLWVDIRTGALGTGALELTDFNSAATSTQVAAFNKTPALGWYSSLPFNLAGRNAINKAGITQMRLYFGLDDNNNHLTDLIKFFSGDSVSDKPVLTITYTLP